MVIGKGMIAKSLFSFIDDNEVLIFASGVSNSMTDKEEDFIREKSLLLSFSKFGGKFIYFSTCSIFDHTLANSKYVCHKKQMEKIIADTFKDYLILRLPTVVGNGANPHVFFNHIKTKLINSETINVFKNSTRFLIALDDIPSIVKMLLDMNLPPSIINVAFNNSASVVEIIDLMKSRLNSNSLIFLEDKGSDLMIDNSDFLKIVSIYKHDFISLNFESVILKYI